VRGALATVVGFLACSALVVVVAFALDAGSAATVVSRLGLHAGDGLMMVLLTALVAPNAVLLGGAYVLGPGFAVGTGTVVSPSVVQLGPVPAFPLLAALPSGGTQPGWLSGLLAAPVVAGLLAAVLVVRRYPAFGYETGAVRGLGSGVLGAVLLTVLTMLAGGAVGPGRMADIGAALPQTLVSAVVAMGIGGLVGGVAATWWVRRRAAR
jgi:hypothetical protein